MLFNDIWLNVKEFNKLKYNNNNNWKTPSSSFFKYNKTSIIIDKFPIVDTFKLTDENALRYTTKSYNLLIVVSDDYTVSVVSNLQ